MEFIKQYIKIISYICSGLVFAFASFYLLANLYHYFELRKDYIADLNNHTLVMKLEDTVNQINTNMNTFNPNTYVGNVSTSNMMSVKSSLAKCVNSFNNETYRDIRNKSVITIIDVYNLRESYENAVLNDCIVGGLLSWILDVDEGFGSTYLINNREVMKLYIDSLLSATSYLKKDLLNNSSYYYNTAIASSSMLDNTRDGFNEVMDAYNKAADFVLFVSNWYKMEAGA